MTKAQIIAEITSAYKNVGNAVELSDTDPNRPLDTKAYIINIFENGLSGKGKKPVGYRRNLAFYVHKEGDPLEEAYYSQNELTNSVNSDVTGSGDLTNIGDIYSSSVFRNRIIAAIIKAANDVYNEATSTANHSIRLRWATDAITLPDKYLSTMAGFVALDSTVQSTGGTVSDTVIQNIVNGSIEDVASIQWPVPDPPSLSLPANNAVGQSTSPLLSWTTISSASSYHLQLSSQSDFSDLIFNQTSITITSYTVTGLSASTSYYWRVRAVDDGTSIWSAIRHFTTA